MELLIPLQGGGRKGKFPLHDTMSYGQGLHLEDLIQFSPPNKEAAPIFCLHDQQGVLLIPELWCFSSSPISTATHIQHKKWV